jgi:hypothetical protein
MMLLTGLLFTSIEAEITYKAQADPKRNTQIFQVFSQIVTPLYNSEHILLQEKEILMSTTSTSLEAPHQQNLRQLFIRLKRVRNISLGIGAVGTGVLIGSAYKPLGIGSMTTAVTLTTLSLSTAATAQLLLSLNTQLENLLNTPSNPNKEKNK